MADHSIHETTRKSMNPNLNGSEQRDGGGEDGSVHLEGLTKMYGGFAALKEIDLHVRSGELFSILGPSGSGKSTMLHLIAGFTQATSGTVRISGKNVNRVPSNRRGLGVIFQSYNLFPHMSVRDNIAYPLSVRRVSKEETEERVMRVLSLVGMDGSEGKLPHQLSGGQQQRIAIARALVFNPRVLLMDEPMSALDRKIRRNLQVEFKRIQRSIGVTMIYVTHDQEEALMMSDRLAVLNNGLIEQVGTPAELYENPASLFTAQFIGDSETFPAHLSHVGEGQATAVLRDGTMLGCRPVAAAVGDPVWLNVRSERIELAHEAGQATGVPGEVRDVMYVGDTVRYIVAAPALGEVAVTVLNTPSAVRFGVGQKVRLTISPTELNTFPRQDEEASPRSPVPAGVLEAHDA